MVCTGRPLGCFSWHKLGALLSRALSAVFGIRQSNVREGIDGSRVIHPSSPFNRGTFSMNMVSCSCSFIILNGGVIALSCWLDHVCVNTIKNRKMFLFTGGGAALGQGT